MKDLFGDDPQPKRKRSRGKPTVDPEQMVFNFPSERPASYAPPSKEDDIYFADMMKRRCAELGDLRACEGFFDKECKLKGSYAPTENKVIRDPLEVLMDEINENNAGGGLHDLTTH